MPLTTGTRFGQYEILGPLGAGGMGEVYRARDTKLNRDVAVKVLPEALANDRERLARFAREAQALAALNHPNIATIYGVEDGATPTRTWEFDTGEYETRFPDYDGPVISPDGTMIAFDGNGRGRLSVRDLDTLAPRDLAAGIDWCSSRTGTS